LTASGKSGANLLQNIAGVVHSCGCNQGLNIGRKKKKIQNIIKNY